MKKLIVLTVLTLLVSLAYALVAPFFGVRALVANPHFAPRAIPQTQTPKAIRTLPGLEEIRVWLGPNIITEHSFRPDHIALTERRATLDFSSFDMRPPAPEGRAQVYDVFYSNADGTLNPDGSYLTLEAASNNQTSGLGGGNVAEVGLKFSGSTTFEYGNVVASFVALGNNKNPELNSNAIDGDTQTYSTLGNTAGQSERLRITIGFLSSLGPPPSALRTVRIEDAEVREGDIGTTNAVFKVRLSSPGPAPVTVGYSTQDFTAAAPNDYTATSGILTFPANSSTTLMTITVPVVGDTLYEAAEQFFVNLTGPVNAGIERGQATGTIIDGEPGSITLCSNDTPKPLDTSMLSAITESTVTLDREGMIDDVDVGIHLSYSNVFARQLRTTLHSPGTAIPLTQPRRDVDEPRKNLAGDRLGTTCSPSPCSPSPCLPSPDCVFDDDADTVIYDGLTPYIGRFIPDSDLVFTNLRVFERKSAKGTWKLSIDHGGEGTLHCWCLTFTFPREGCNLRPGNARVPIFSPHTVEALLTSNGAPVANQPVSFEVLGEQGELRFRKEVTSDASGVAELVYYDFKPGQNLIEARAIINGVPSISLAAVTWVDEGLSNFNPVNLCLVERSSAGTRGAETTLSAARSFRDDVLARSSRGKAYTGLYYKFSSEAVRVMMFSPMLMLRSREIIERYKPVIQSMLNGERVTLTRGDLDEIEGFLNSFAAKGSPQLHQAVKQVCEDLKNPNVHDEFHITVVEGPKREMPAHHLPRIIKGAGGTSVFLGFCVVCAFFLARRHHKYSRTKANSCRLQSATRRTGK